MITSMSLVELHREVNLVTLLRALEGASGNSANKARRDPPFRWQEGYGAFSVSESHIESVIEYVKNQRAHHASGSLAPEWELSPVDHEPAG